MIEHVHEGERPPSPDSSPALVTSQSRDVCHSRDPFLLLYSEQHQAARGESCLAAYVQILQLITKRCTDPLAPSTELNLKLLRITCNSSQTRQEHFTAWPRSQHPADFSSSVILPRWLRGLCFCATRGCWHCGIDTGTHRAEGRSSPERGEQPLSS